MLDDGYLPLKELCTYSGLSERMLRKYLHDAANPLPHYQVGAKILVRRSEFDRWVQEYRIANARMEGEAARILREMVAK